MQAEELDLAYTELCQALARAGEPQAPLFLATLCLALIAHQPASAGVLAAIQQAEQLCAQNP